MNTCNVIEAYTTLQSACGIEEGDTVRILRKAASNEMGWNDIWTSDMDRCVGMAGEVLSVGIRGIRVRIEEGTFGHQFPFFVLEKVSAAFIMINGYKVPAPLRELLPIGSRYYIVDFNAGFCNKVLSTGAHMDDYLRKNIELGIVHRTKEAAELHATALLSFFKEYAMKLPYTPA